MTVFSATEMQARKSSIVCKRLSGFPATISAAIELPYLLAATKSSLSTATDLSTLSAFSLFEYVSSIRQRTSTASRIAPEIIKVRIQADSPAVLMELEQAIRDRRSVRAFEDRDMPHELIDKALELASWAPSAGNLQSRDFIVVRSAETREALASAAGGQDFVAQAPVVIVAIANLERVMHYGKRGRDLYAIQDSAAAVQNLLLILHSKGLATTWVGAFNESQVSQILGLPGHARPVAILPIGYPAETPAPRDHLPFGEYVHDEKW